MPSDGLQAGVTVSELTLLIKRTLEKQFPNIWVTGEISNYKRHTSGHLYFTLKDEQAQIAAVLWRSRASALAFELQDGMMVAIRGSVTVYPPRGSYQLEVLAIRPLGAGALQIAFEKLKKKLADEGLFDPSRKKPLPQFPGRIGIITSSTGAAVRDILTTLKRRFPVIEVLLFPVRVQGMGAADEIAEAIEYLNQHTACDVLIVGRGGGSLEDLWAFNEERVARAIFESKIPVISAVGHEIDFTIADFVADVRAATPTAAAELAVPDKKEILDSLRNNIYLLNQYVRDFLETGRDRIQSLVESYNFNKPRELLKTNAQRVDEATRLLALRMNHYVELFRHRFASARNQLLAYDPVSILRRGYVIVKKGDRVVVRAAELTPGDKATLTFNDGTVHTTVEGN